MTTKIGTLALVWHGVAAALVTLTAYATSPLQNEQKNSTEAATSLAPITEPSAPQTRSTDTAEKNASSQKDSTEAAAISAPITAPSTPQAHSTKPAEQNAPSPNQQKDNTEAAAIPAPITAPSAPQATASKPSAASPGYAVRWLRPSQGRDENDDVQVIDHGWRRGLQLVVTSKSGIGEVEIEPTNAVWPRQIEVQFQYASGQPFTQLERIYVQVDTWPGEQKAALESFDNFVFWQRDGALRVDLPDGWLHDRQTLHMAWADRIASSLVPSKLPKTPSAK